MKRRINVVGLGYIGLPTALMFATHGAEVIGTDVNRRLISSLKSRHISFSEKGLTELFDKAMESGMGLSDECVSADVYVVAVPTPYDKENKRIDSSYVSAAVKSVSKVCPKGATVVIESTVPPGTIDGAIRPIFESAGFVIGEEIKLVHAPERIIPGNMLHELTRNPRVIGADDRAVGEDIKALYSSFCTGQIVVTDIRTAEMSKVVENTYRDINIAFANELAKICRSGMLNVYEIIRIANMHPRVNILQPGPGVGGHCISVDPWFLVGDYPGLANIILAARKINDSMPEFVLERVHDIMRERGMTDFGQVGLYGLTYKENVDDVRESPTLQLLECMNRHLAPGLKVYDPYVRNDLVANQYHDLDEFLSGVSFVVIMVAHDEIKANMGKLAGKIVLDTRNVCALDGVYKL